MWVVGVYDRYDRLKLILDKMINESCSNSWDWPFEENVKTTRHTCHTPSKESIRAKPFLGLRRSLVFLRDLKK